MRPLTMSKIGALAFDTEKKKTFPTEQIKVNGNPVPLNIGVICPVVINDEELVKPQKIRAATPTKNESACSCLYLSIGR